MQAVLGFIAGCLVTFAALFAAREPQSAPATPPAPASALVERPEAPESPLYQVIKVIDGDTITINQDGSPTTIRLIGIDAPESSTTRTGSVECFGVEAREFARTLMAGKRVTIRTDPTQDTYDRYGRLLAYIYMEDGTFVNEHLIAEGYAHEYTYRDPYEHQADFKAAESGARIQGRGLWAPSTCVPAASAAPVRNAAAAGSYECTRNTYNCSSFSTQAEAQAAFDACGGSGNDVHKLDGNGDGEVCESLQ